ncbi:MAG: hypothetical protein WB820_00270 [Rhodoplanes sp.]
MANDERWPGLTSGQLRVLAREYCAAILDADSIEALPSDAWLDVRLRDHGCPSDQPETWRERVKAAPLPKIADQAQ